jgi:hypothetical protein
MSSEWTHKFTPIKKNPDKSFRWLKCTILFLFLLVFTLPGCKKEERSRLNQRETQILDSLYSSMASQLRKDGDSLCRALRDSIFYLKVDSILDIRMAEVQFLLEDDGNE